MSSLISALSVPVIAMAAIWLFEAGNGQLRLGLVDGLIILGLVLLNGLFVAAEFAIIGVRKSRLEARANEGDNAAKRIVALLDDPEAQDRYIATAQLGITIASLGLGMYGEPRIAGSIAGLIGGIGSDAITSVASHSIATVVALALLTYLHIVLGEMVPKSIALTSADKAAFFLSRPMAVAGLIFSIPVTILNSIGRAFLTLLKIPPADGRARLHSAEELELIVSQSAEGGLLLEEEGEMIRNIFDFGARQVGQVMTPRRKVQAIPHNIGITELLAEVTESRYSRLPVFQEDLDHILGILHIKDLVRQQLRSKGSFDLRLLLRPAPSVPETQPVVMLLSAFKRQQLNMAIVLDEFGGMAGVVTLEDLVEEVVGEVRDEFDLEREELIELAPGKIEVIGAYLVDDLEDQLDLGDEATLPDVETVGGLIVAELGRPPIVGDKVELELSSTVTVTVLEIDGLAVARARLEFSTEPDAD